jgi:hypothetical protein
MSSSIVYPTRFQERQHEYATWDYQGHTYYVFYNSDGLLAIKARNSYYSRTLATMNGAQMRPNLKRGGPDAVHSVWSISNALPPRPE